MELVSPVAVGSLRNLPLAATHKFNLFLETSYGVRDTSLIAY